LIDPNETALVEIINERRTMINTIMKRKRNLIVHLLSHNQFIIIIMEKKINGKKTRGRPRKSIFEEISRKHLKMTKSDKFERLGFKS